MRHFLLGIALFVTIMTAGVATAEQKPARRPNVILFFSDDQGSLDVGCYGAKDLKTPHLDKLAKRGVRFTQFYVAAPVCSPSRAALITGCYPQRAGVPGNVSSRPNHGGMPNAEFTIAEVLKTLGYRTGIVGKWHLGTDNKSDPQAQGFDHFFGHKAGCIDNYSHFFYWSGPPIHDLYRNRKEIHHEGKYFTDMVVDESQKFITKNKENPFFLYVPFNIPHYPLQAPAKFRAMYKDLKEPRRAYAAMISTLDDAVGRILAKVDELELADDTIVIFLSDHGHSTEERNNFGGGFCGVLRGAKFSLFEGGVRVPCIISWPKHLPKDQTRNQPCMSIVILPTIAELCGAKLPKRKIDGKSLVPVLNSSKAKAPRKVLHWKLGQQWAIREGDWKLVVNPSPTNRGVKIRPQDRIFLSNLANDPGERNNVAKANPEVVRRLTQLHQAWAKTLKREE